MGKTLSYLLMLYSGCAMAAVELISFDSPPLVEINHNRYSGTSYRLVTSLFKQAGVHFSLANKPPRRALDYVQNTPNTCVFPIDRSQTLEASYRWIGPVAINRYAFYSKQENAISLTTLQDAKPYSIAVFSGTGLGDYLNQRGHRVTENNRIEQGIRMLDYGRVDLWVAELNAAKLLTKQYALTDVSQNLVFFTTLSFMACNLALDQESYEHLRKELKKMHQNGLTQDLFPLN